MTIFKSHHGVYRFIRIPFGLKHAPVTFQRAVEVILSTAKWHYFEVYWYDIVVFSRSLKEHMGHLRNVLALLAPAGLTFNKNMCNFLGNKIDNLGHVIKPGRFEMADHTTDAIRDLKDPATITELKSILSPCNVFGSFVQNCSWISAPLNANLSKYQPSKFGALSYM